MSSLFGYPSPSTPCTHTRARARNAHIHTRARVSMHHHARPPARPTRLWANPTRVAARLTRRGAGHAANTLFHAVPAARRRRISLTFRRLKPHAAAYLSLGTHPADATTDAVPCTRDAPHASAPRGGAQPKTKQGKKPKAPMLCNHPHAVSSCRACAISPGGSAPGRPADDDHGHEAATPVAVGAGGKGTGDAGTTAPAMC